MKMKKILALLVGATMTFSSIAANAAIYEFDSGDGIYAVWDETVTAEQVEARELTVTADVKQMTYAEATAAKINKSGLTTLKETDYDFYQVTVDLDGIGDLLNGLDLQDGESVAAIKLMTASVWFEGMTEVKKVLTTSTFNNIAWTFTYDQPTWGGYGLKWNAATSPYPGENALHLDFSFEDVVGYLAVAKGTTFENVKVKAEANFGWQHGNTQKAVCANTLSAASTATVDFAPAVEEDKPVVFTAALKEDTDFGYIWALTFTQSADKLASFKAVFAADGVEPAERAISNVAEVAAALGGASAPVVLNVGLETTKTLTAARFTADDAVEATAACVVDAPISK